MTVGVLNIGFLLPWSEFLFVFFFKMKKSMRIFNHTIVSLAAITMQHHSAHCTHIQNGKIQMIKNVTKKRLAAFHFFSRPCVCVFVSVFKPFKPTGLYLVWFGLVCMLYIITLAVASYSCEILRLTCICDVCITLFALRNALTSNYSRRLSIVAFWTKNKTHSPIQLNKCEHIGGNDFYKLLLNNP